MTLGEKIQKLRASNGWSQEQLAEQITVSRQSVSKWELDQSIPDVEYIKQMGKLFNVSIDYLLNEKCISPEKDASYTTENMHGKWIVRVGLIIMDLFAFLIGVLMFAAIAVPAAFALCCATAGFCMIFSLNIANLIPYIPYIPSVIVGLSLIWLAVLSAVVTKWYSVLSADLVKRYAGWHKRIWNYDFLSSNEHSYSISVSVKEKKIVLIALGIFGVLFVLGLIVMFIYTGFVSPWHYWHWFAG